MLTWAYGQCGLAASRDQVAEDGAGPLVGFVPYERVDGTLLLGVITGPDGEVIGTLLNYACHPTSLGHGNRLLSPDYVGAARELVEQANGGAPCLFLQGASGDLAPKRQYTDDPRVADANGRELGYAALSTQAGMLGAGCKLCFQEAQESTARLGIWREVVDPRRCTEVAQKIVCVEYPLRRAIQDQVRGGRVRLDDLASCAAPDCADSECAGPDRTTPDRATPDRAALERAERTLQLWDGLENADTSFITCQLWRLGDTMIVAAPAEMHSVFQQALRRDFPRLAVVALNLTNGSLGYLPPLESFRSDSYQSRTTLFEAGAYESILERVVSEIESMIDEPAPTARPEYVQAGS